MVEPTLATSTCFSSTALISTVRPWESVASGFLTWFRFHSSIKVWKSELMNQPKKNWTFTSSQPEDAQQFLWSQGSHKVAWSSPQYLEMFWSRIEWPSRADLSQWPNGQQNCLSAYPVLHRTELPNWKKMRQQTGKNDILWSYPATSLPICVTRKSVIKVNKKVHCVLCLYPALLVKGRYSATSMHQWSCASRPALHATALSDHEHRARLDPLLSKHQWTSAPGNET